MDIFQSFMIKKLGNLRKLFSYHLSWYVIEVPFFDNFGKTVNLNFDGLTGGNSLCSISSQEITKKDQCFSCPSELNVHSLRVGNQSQNSSGTAMQMWATLNLSFRSISYIDFDLFCS